MTLSGQKLFLDSFLFKIVVDIGVILWKLSSLVIPMVYTHCETAPPIFARGFQFQTFNTIPRLFYGKILFENASSITRSSLILSFLDPTFFCFVWSDSELVWQNVTESKIKFKCPAVNAMLVFITTCCFSTHYCKSLVKCYSSGERHANNLQNSWSKETFVQ